MITRKVEQLRQNLKNIYTDTHWKRYNLKKLADDQHPELSTDELTRPEPPTVEASRLDGTGNPNHNTNN